MHSPRPSSPSNGSGESKDDAPLVPLPPRQAQINALPTAARKKRRRVGGTQASRFPASLNLSHIPRNPVYYRSYMHRAIVTHVTITSTTVISASEDGRLTFWDRDIPSDTNSFSSARGNGTTPVSSVPITRAPDSKNSALSEHPNLTFIKAFQAHRGALAALHVTPHQDNLVTTSASDNSLKVFTIDTVDLAQFTALPHAPAASVVTVPFPDRVIVPLRDEPSVLILNLHDVSASPLVIHVARYGPLARVAVNPRFSTLILCDGTSSLDYVRIPIHRPQVTFVDGDDYADADDDSDGNNNNGGSDSSKNYNRILNVEDEFKHDVPGVTFQSRLRTDLFTLARIKTTATSLSVSPTGFQFAVAATDGRIRVFDFATGRVRRVYDEGRTTTLPATVPAQESARRRARNAQFWTDATSVARANVTWDETGSCIVYATMLGIKVVHVESNRVVRALGLREAAVRFLAVAIAHGDAHTEEGDANVDTSATDTLRGPLVVASAFDSERMFLFGSGETVVEATRDVYNERGLARQRDRTGGGHDAVVLSDGMSRELPRRATLHTSVGDIVIELFPQSAPRAVENFATHGRNGYFNGVTFHRVIKNFMIQTGDPDGDGSGGQSIWGTPFEDEFDDMLKHEVGTVSMANAGSNTNGSVRDR